MLVDLVHGVYNPDETSAYFVLLKSSDGNSSSVWVELKLGPS